MRPSPRLPLALLLVAVVAPTTQAHFKMLEPASWLVESDRGDPQKAGPCGGDGKGGGTPTNVIGKAVGGSKIHLKDHHCADFEITADPAKPLDKGWPESK